MDCGYGVIWLENEESGVSGEAGGVDFESEQFRIILERHAGLVRQNHDWDRLTSFFCKVEGATGTQPQRLELRLHGCGRKFVGTSPQ